MKIYLVSDNCGYEYFSINVGYKSYCTSNNIANLFNMPIDTYNQILTEKVIMHDTYYTCALSQMIKYEKDVMFSLNNVPKEVYLNRFKEAFSEQLILLTFGDWH